MTQAKLLLVAPLAVFAFSCSGGDGDGDGDGGGAGGEDCSVASFSVADLGGVLLLPGDQSFSRANIGANGQLLWAWDQAIGHLNSEFEFEWILDASAEVGLANRTISYATSDSGRIFANGHTSDFGGGDVDTWLCEYTCSGEVVSGSQIAYGSSLDESLVSLFNDTYQNRSFDLDDDTGEPHVHWLNGIHLPDPSDPTDMHAIVGRIDSEAGTEWVRTADLDAGGFSNSRGFNGGGLSIATRKIGPVYEGYLVHLDTEGNVQWEVSTNGAFDFVAGTGRLRLADDRFLITGYTEAAGNDKRALAIAVGPSGPEWNLSIGDDGDTEFEGAVQLTGGDIVAYGTVNIVGSSASRALFVRMDSDGTVITQHSYGDGLNDYEISELALMPDGTLTVLVTVGTDAWVASLNQNGIIQWQHNLTTDSALGGYFELVDPAETESYTTSDVMVFGFKGDVPLPFGAGNLDVLATVIDTSGVVSSALQWTNTHGSTGPRVYTDENTGSLYLFADVVNPSGPGGEDGLLVQYDSQLNYVWSKLYGGANDDSIGHLDFNEDGEILVSGLTNSFDSTDVDPFLIGLGLDGETTQSCWTNGVTPSTFTGIATGTASDITLTMSEATLSFIDVNLLSTPAFAKNSASHTISSTSATLEDSCD